MAQHIPDNSIDLTVTSPPYDNLRTYKGFTFDFDAIAAQLWRVTKPGGVVVWVVGDGTDNGSETCSSFVQALFFRQLGFNLHDTMIYMKSGPSYPSQDKYYQVWEYMFIFSKGKPATFHPLKDRFNRWHGEKWSKVRTRRNEDGDLKRTVWDSDEGEQYGTRFNIWQYAVGAGNQGDELAHVHPASFPEALAQDHIASWSNPGDVVLDPMMGSGTTGKEAIKAGRRFIGIDIAAEYVELARERIGRAQLQPSLITPPPNKGFHLTAAPVGLWDAEDESGAAAAQLGR